MILSCFLLQALTVGVGTVMDAREVLVLITGANKAIALYKAIEEGVCHMWTVCQYFFTFLKCPNLSISSP